MKKVVKEVEQSISVNKLSDSDIIGGRFESGVFFQVLKIRESNYILATIGKSNDGLDEVIHFASIALACEYKRISELYVFEAPIEFIDYLQGTI